MRWYEPSFVYQVYPLGLCGAPHENDGVTVPRLRKLVDDGWVDHMKRLGATCLMLNPVFQRLTHGYDTTDYTSHWNDGKPYATFKAYELVDGKLTDTTIDL